MRGPFRTGCFPLQVTEDDLDKVYRDYRGSAEETADLLQLYQRFHGDMAQVFCNM